MTPMCQKPAGFTPRSCRILRAVNVFDRYYRGGRRLGAMTAANFEDVGKPETQCRLCRNRWISGDDRLRHAPNCKLAPRVASFCHSGRHACRSARSGLGDACFGAGPCMANRQQTTASRTRRPGLADRQWSAGKTTDVCSWWIWSAPRRHGCTGIWPSGWRPSRRR